MNSRRHGHDETAINSCLLDVRHMPSSARRRGLAPGAVSSQLDTRVTNRPPGGYLDSCGAFDKAASRIGNLELRPAAPKHCLEAAALVN